MEFQRLAEGSRRPVSGMAWTKTSEESDMSMALNPMPKRMEGGNMFGMSRGGYKKFSCVCDEFVASRKRLRVLDGI